MTHLRNHTTESESICFLTGRKKSSEKLLIIIGLKDLNNFKLIWQEKLNNVKDEKTKIVHNIYEIQNKFATKSQKEKISHRSKNNFVCNRKQNSIQKQKISFEVNSQIFPTFRPEHTKIIFVQPKQKFLNSNQIMYVTVKL